MFVDASSGNNLNATLKVFQREVLLGESVFQGTDQYWFEWTLHAESQNVSFALQSGDIMALSAFLGPTLPRRLERELRSEGRRLEIQAVAFAEERGLHPSIYPQRTPVQCLQCPLSLVDPESMGPVGGTRSQDRYDEHLHLLRTELSVLFHWERVRVF